MRDLEVELDRKITLPNGPGMMRKVRETGIETTRSSLWLRHRESAPGWRWWRRTARSLAPYAAKPGNVVSKGSSPGPLFCHLFTLVSENFDTTYSVNRDP